MGKRVPISIRGLVIAAEWTQRGDIAAVDIAGYDEKCYRIADNQLGRQLLAYVKKRVSAEGSLDTENGNRILYLEHFRVEDPDESSSVTEKCRDL